MEKELKLKKVEASNKELAEQNVFLRSRVKNLEDKLLAKDEEDFKKKKEKKKKEKSKSNDEEVFVLKNQIEDLQQELNQIKIELEAEKGKNTSHVQNNEELAKTAQEMKEKIVSLTSSNTNIINRTKKLKKEISAYSQRMEKQQLNFDNRLEEKEREINHLRLEVEGKTVEVNELSSELERHQALISDIKPEDAKLVQNLQYTIKSKEIVQAQLKDEVEVIRQNNDTLKKKIQYLENNAVAKEDYELVIQENDELKEIYSKYEDLKANYDSLVRQMDKAKNERNKFLENLQNENKNDTSDKEQISKDNMMLLKQKVEMIKKYKGLRNKMEKMREKNDRFVYDVIETVHNSDLNTLEMRKKVLTLIRDNNDMSDSQVKIDSLQQIENDFTFNDGKPVEVKGAVPNNPFKTNNVLSENDNVNKADRDVNEDKSMQTSRFFFETKPVTVNNQGYSEYRTVKYPNHNIRQSVHNSTQQNYYNSIPGKIQAKVTFKRANPREAKENVRYIHQRPRSEHRYVTQKEQSYQGEVRCDRFKCYCTNKSYCNVSKIDCFEEKNKVLSPFLYMTH